jgi:hypothetical protein
MNINFGKSRLKKTLSFIVFATLTIFIIIYLPCDIYNFQPAQKFSGEYLYNPYQNLSYDWQKTNFHAHAVAWNGVTCGKQHASEILKSYSKKRYDYSSISNYESLAEEDEQPNSINVYEHGYNASKTHQLVIIPQQVCYNDFPFFQFASSKQFVLNKLNSGAKAIVLAHPSVRDGYKDDDIKKLTGYNLMEILNHACNASNKWDIALSTGKPVWIIGDDDTHDVLDSTQTFRNWTMINSQHNKDSLINNLINGNAYAVHGKNALNDNILIGFKVNGMYISLRLQKNADSIKLIGQNGVAKQVFLNTDSAGYTFTNNDTYIRAVIYNKASTIYTNPVIRYDGKLKPQNFLTATTNYTETILYRSFLLISWLIFFLLLYPNLAKHIAELFKNNLSRKLPKLSPEIE